MEGWSIQFGANEKSFWAKVLITDGKYCIYSYFFYFPEDVFNLYWRHPKPKPLRVNASSKGLCIQYLECVYDWSLRQLLEHDVFSITSVFLYIRVRLRSHNITWLKPWVTSVVMRNQGIFQILKTENNDFQHQAHVLVEWNVKAISQVIHSWIHKRLAWTFEKANDWHRLSLKLELTWHMIGRDQNESQVHQIFK